MRLSIVALLAVAAGCVHPMRSGHFVDSGYYHRQGHYRVRLADGEPRSLLAPPWRVVGYELDAEGNPDHEIAGMLRSTPPPGVSRYPGLLARGNFDFLYRRADHSVIWARTVPLPRDVAALPLADIAHLALHLADVPWPRITGEQSVTAPGITPIEDADAVLDGEPAHLMSFGLRMGTPGGVIEREMTFVVVRPPRQPRRHPQAVFFACASQPERHAADRAELEAMLRRVDFAR